MEVLYHRLNHLTYMLEYIPDKELLKELVRALSNDDARDNFNYICNNHNIPEYDD